MADSNKHTPLLRFPEFLNDEEWAMDSMESIFEIKNGYTPSKSNPDFGLMALFLGSGWKTSEKTGIFSRTLSNT